MSDPNHVANEELSAVATPKAQVLSGSAVLLTGLALVTTFNFTYNMAVARLLGPAAFGHASVIYTLLTLMAAVTLSFQIVSAKVVAQQTSAQAKAAAYRKLHRSAWLGGLLSGGLLVLLRGTIAHYLNLPGSGLVVWLAVGVAFYVPLGARRGYLIGALGFRHLATSLVLEAFVRLCGTLVLVRSGWGVTGVVIAIAGAEAAAYFFAVPSTSDATATLEVEVPHVFREALQAIVFFSGQVIINNCDIVLVKHFFAPAEAGLYAAVALVGRVVFAFSWAVVNSMFPIAAGTRKRSRKNHGILGTALALVSAIGVTFVVALRLAPAHLWTALFGSQFAVAGSHGISNLLALYAATTALFSISVVLIAYEMSYRIANTSWVQLAFSGVLIGGIYLFHSSLHQVILVQMAMMVVLILVVSAPFLARQFNYPEQVQPVAETFAGFRVIRRVPEEEVIAAFLKNDSSDPEFEEYRQALDPLLESPNLNDAEENAKRRALLFVRHDALWRELPASTEWFQVELGPADLTQIRVFPRAQWRKLAQGDFSLLEVADSVAARRQLTDEDFFGKIGDLRRSLTEAPAVGAVLLIGKDESGPFTILDGNHRLVAATLTSPGALRKLKFFCGLSPQMDQCCWYETNLTTLFRYGKNLVKHTLYDPEAELARSLRGPWSS